MLYLDPHLTERCLEGRGRDCWSQAGVWLEPGGGAGEGGVVDKCRGGGEAG